MNVKLFLLGLAFWGSAGAMESSSPPAQAPARIAKILSRGDGRSEQTAYKVKSVREEYQILEVLGLAPGTQSLVQRKSKPFDVIEATDPRTGATREVWFDISSLYPEF